jgi:site-specific DNA recombinase
LTETLSQPDHALEAADTIREIIDRVVVTPGEKRGSHSITLECEFGTILDWIDRSGKPG